jgi:cytidine deaminase
MKLEPEIQNLIQKAWEVRQNAYTPYYKYPVGCALLAEDGRIYVGCNVENVAGSVIACAEVTALGSAVASGVRSFKAIAIAGPENNFLLPCGSCRQRLIEFSPNLEVLAAKKNGDVERHKLSDLLPGQMVLK